MKIKYLKRPKIRMRRPRIRIRWRKKTSRWVIGAAVLFFISLFVLQLVLMSYTKTIVQNVLSMQIQQATDGLYEASFEDIDISYTQRNLTIHNLHLEPQENSENNGNKFSAQASTYDILVPEIKINGINLRKAYLEASIEIQSLELLQAYIVLNINFDKAPYGSRRLRKEDLHKLLPASVNHLTVGTISVTNATMELNAIKDQQNSHITASSLSLELQNFYLDHHPSEDQDQILFTDGFYLASDRVFGTLADSTYQLNLKSLNASSADSSAFAQEVILKPLREIKDMADHSSLRNAYAFEFQQLYLYGLSFHELYHYRQFVAEEITILNPGFELYNLQELLPGQKENFRIEDLYPAIDKVLNSVQIQQLNLTNGNLSIMEYKDGLHNKLSSAIQKAHISNFLLDSAASSNEEKLLYADKIDITLLDYNMRLSDQLHLLQANELNFSTESREISARGFRVTYDSSSHKMAESNMLYQASVPLIHLKGVDMLTAYNHNRLNIQSLQLSGPDFTINQPPVTDPRPVQQSNSFHEEDLYALVEDYLYTLNIDKISLQKGNFQVARQQAAGQDAFVTQIRRAGLWDFRLDSTSAYQMNKLFYADDFEIEIENYSQELPDKIHRIEANEIAISTLSDDIYIREVSISAGSNEYPYKNIATTDVKTLINLNIPEIKLEGVDILKAYLDKKLVVKRVLIPFPVFQMGTLIGNESERSDLIKSNALYEIMKEYLELIQVEELQLQEGELDLVFYAENGPLTISGRSTNLQVENFRFDSLSAANPTRLFFAENLDIRIGNYETTLPDQIHVIRAEEVMASTDLQEVHALDVSVNTVKDRYTDEELLVIYQQKGFLRLEVPEIKITGIDFDKAYYDKELFIDSVYAAKPKVHYTFLPQSSIDKKKKKIRIKQTGFYESMAPYLEVFSLKQLVMEDGLFRTEKQIANKQENHLLLDGIALKMDDFFVDSAAIYDSKRFLYAKDISLKIDQYRQELVDRLHILSARNMELSTSMQHVKASTILLAPKKEGLSNALKAENKNLNRYNIELPTLQINGISFDEVYEHDRLHIQELLIDDPQFRIRHYVNQKEASDQEQKDQKIRNNTLRELIRGNLQAITVDTTRINNGQGEYQRFENNSQSRFKTRHFAAAVQRFHLESGEESTNGPFHADDIHLVISDYERKLGDSLHILSVDKLMLSTRERLLSLNGVELRPRMDKDVTQRLQLAQKDRLYHIRVPLCQLQGVSLEQLQHDSLIVENLLVKEPSIELIRFTDLGIKKKKSNKSAPSLYERLPDNLRYIQSDRITIEDGQLALSSIGTKDSSTFRIGNISGKAQHFVLDSLSKQEEGKIFFADRLELQVKDYITNLDNNLYELQIRKVYFDSWEKNLIADSIMLTPLVNRATFAKTKGYETDQFTFRNKQLKLKNINYQLLMDKGEFYADSLLLDGFNLHVYRDKRQPYPEDHNPKMPQESLRNMSLPFLLKGFEIRGGYIGYAERAKGTRTEGFIDLTNLNMSSDTITNHAALVNNGLTTNINLSCYLMGTGFLQASLDIPLGDSLNRHTIQGTLDPMALPDFNPILEKTVFVKIRSGQLNKIDFYFEADRYAAEGIMEFHYQDLKVALVNKKTGKTGGPVKELGSLVANMFVIETNNTEEEEKPLRKGDMAYTRDDSRSIVNYWVKTLVNGFKSSIGI